MSMSILPSQAAQQITQTVGVNQQRVGQASENEAATGVRATQGASYTAGLAAIAYQRAGNDDDAAQASRQKSATGVDLDDPAVQDTIRRLEARDLEVRVHEQAHIAAGGQHVTSGASYTYQTGPDGKRYAIGGEVGIDTSPVNNDPAATIEKAEQIVRSAMAPAEPSSQDYAVARQAQSMMVEARQELAAAEQEERLAVDNEAAEQTADDFSAEIADDRFSLSSATNSTAPFAELFNQLQGIGGNSNQQTVNVSDASTANASASTATTWQQMRASSLYQATESMNMPTEKELVGGFQHNAPRIGIYFSV